MQNCYSESCNGKFRDEHLNECWFEILHQARMSVATWRQDYNVVRPHSSLGCMPPARFAELHRKRWRCSSSGAGRGQARMGLACQICSAYSAMVRSDEKGPMPATLVSAFLAQSMGER